MLFLFNVQLRNKYDDDAFKKYLPYDVELTFGKMMQELSCNNLYLAYQINGRHQYKKSNNKKERLNVVMRRAFYMLRQKRGCNVVDYVEHRTFCSDNYVCHCCHLSLDYYV